MNDDRYRVNYTSLCLEHEIIKYGQTQHIHLDNQTKQNQSVNVTATYCSCYFEQVPCPRQHDLHDSEKKSPASAVDICCHIVQLLLYPNSIIQICTFCQKLSLANIIYTSTIVEWVEESSHCIRRKYKGGACTNSHLLGSGANRRRNDNPHYSTIGRSGRYHSHRHNPQFRTTFGNH
jgi:hypothetical protein